jgi:hypothetical protein
VTQTEQQGHSPFVLAHEAQSAADFQLRITDKITKFAGRVSFGTRIERTSAQAMTGPAIALMANARLMVSPATLSGAMFR